MTVMTSPVAEREGEAPAATMRAAVFRGPGDIGIEHVPRPRPARRSGHSGDADDDLRHRRPHPARASTRSSPGSSSATSPSASSRSSAPASTGYEIGDRVLVGAITPCGQCHACLAGKPAQCGHGAGYEAIGGWRFGNTINGAQAEYLLVPYAQANLAKIPESLTDEQVVLLADIASTGFSGAESGKVRIGDTVVVFAQGPIGLCATAGAKLMGAALVIGVEGDPNRAGHGAADGRRRRARLRRRSTSSPRSGA